MISLKEMFKMFSFVVSLHNNDSFFFEFGVFVICSSRGECKVLMKQGIRRLKGSYENSIILRILN